MKLKTFFEGSSRPSALALLIANAVPIIGAAFFGWSIFSLMFLFWFENVIIGVLNIVRFLGVRPSLEDMSAGAPRAMRIFLIGLQIFFAGFFTIHYGGFCFVHGVFVFAIFGKDSGFGSPDDLRSMARVVSQLLIDQKLIYAAVSIFISHSFSLGYNYFYKGERYGAALQSIMGRPYGRIVVLHVTIILGAIPVMILGSPIWALVLLVVLKTCVDLKAHLIERDKMATKRGSS